GDAAALDGAGPVLAAHDVLRPGRMHRVQHLHLLVADGIGAEVGGRLHRRQRDELQQMVLEHVANRPRALVERRPPLDPDRLRDRDLDMVDELPVPDRLEDPVREAQGEQVLDRLLAEVVVDPVNLVLLEVRQELAVQRARGGAVVAERLLDDQPRPAAPLPAAASEHADERRKRRRRHGQVEDAVAAGPALLVQLREQLEQPPFLTAADVARDVAHRRGEPLPDARVEPVTPEPLDRLLHLRAELVVRQLRAGDADERESLGEHVPGRQLVDGREELAVGQVPRRAEDDERAGVRGPWQPQPLEQRVSVAHLSSTDLTACPPNWLRRAAFTFAANDSSCREAKRAKSASVIAGAGTLSSIAFSTVQRPSPESST